MELKLIENKGFKPLSTKISLVFVVMTGLFFLLLSVHMANADSITEVDIDKHQMNFNKPGTGGCSGAKDPTKTGQNWGVGDKCLYENVYTGSDTAGNEITVDAVVEITKIDDDAHINVFDLPDTTYDGRFNPVIYTDGKKNSSGDRFEGVTFSITFYKDSDTISLSHLNTESIVQLLDFYMTVIDLDGSASATEYVEISGFQSYVVDNDTELTPINTDNGIRFKGSPNGKSGLVFYKANSLIVEYSDPISTINIVAGTTNPYGTANSTSDRQFSYDFGAYGGVTGTEGFDPNHSPEAKGLNITGTLRSGSTLTGVYAFDDAESDPDDASTYQWYRGSAADGSNKIKINGATGKTYNVGEEDKGNYLFFEVTPKSSRGSSPGKASITATLSTIYEAPKATNDSYTTEEDKQLDISPSGVLTNDSGDEQATLTAEKVSGPSHGTLTLNSDGSFTYTPEGDYNGTDSFTYKAKDGVDESNEATVTITITAANDAPTVANEIADQTTNEDEPFSLEVENTFEDVDTGDTLTYTSTLSDGSSLPEWLNFNGETGTWSGTPGNGDVGVITVKVVAEDKDGKKAEEEFTITVVNVNDAPTVANGIADQTTNEDEPFSLVVGNTFEDVDAGDTLTYSSTLADGSTLPGWLSFDGETGTWSGTPGNDDVGVITVKVVAEDKDGEKAEEAFTITVVNVNDAPEAADDTYTTNEDTELEITAEEGVLENDTDVDRGDSLTVEKVSGPAHGSLTLNSDGSFTYTPEGDYNGTDSFTYKANDGEDESNEATVTITITAANDAPTVANGIADQTTDEDEPFSLEVGNTFEEVDAGDTLTYSSTLADGNPLPGWLSFDGETGTWSGTPGNDDVGVITVKVVAEDKDGEKAEEAFTITVVNVNDAPEAANDTYTTNEDTELEITAEEGVLENDTDVDRGDSLTVEKVSGPAHGSLTLNSDGSFTYTPEKDFNGTDSFTYKANDGEDESNEATVTITITAVNDAPTVANEITDQTTNEDEPFSLEVGNTFEDVDAGDTLTYSSTLADGNPLPGWLSFDGETGTWSGTPGNDDVGVITVKVVAVDKDGEKAEEAFTITVVNVNDAPEALDDAYTTGEDAPLTIAAPGVLENDTDAEEQPLTAEAVNGPTHGSLTLNSDGSFTYTPEKDFNGTDSFTYKASDGEKDSAVGTVTVTVTSENDNPTASPQSVATHENEAKAIILNGYDLDGDTLTYAIHDNPVHGTIETTEGSQNVTYTPGANYNGPDSFTFTVTDSVYTTRPVLVTITVEPVNSQPVAENQTVDANENGAVDLLLTGTDMENSPGELEYTIVDQPENGQLVSVTGRKWMYRPNKDFVGTDTFQFTVTDLGDGTAEPKTSEPASVTIHVQAVTLNADGGSYTTNEDTPVAITLTGTDNLHSADELDYAIDGNPENGSLTGSGRNWIYSPAANYYGPDQFTFTVTDLVYGKDKQAIVNITVMPVDDAPAAEPQSITTDQETPIAITLNGTDIESPSDELEYVLLDGPSNGQLSEFGRSVTYTPNIGYTGPDQFTFTVTDSVYDSEPATISIEVSPLTPLDGWVGERHQGDSAPVVIVAPGSPLKLSAVSSLAAAKVVATVNGVQVPLALTNGITAAADGKKVWTATNYRLPDNGAAGDYQVAFTALDASGMPVQQEKTERILEDNSYHVRTAITLRGTVIDQETGLPLANALVTLYDPTGTVQIGKPATTDKNGRYRFDAIKTKTYLIEIKRDGFGTKKSMIQAITDTLDSNEIVKDYQLVRFSLVISADPSAIVGDGESTSTLKAVLKDKDGKPIAGVKVEFTAPKGTFAGTGGRTQTAVTNARGEASILYRSDKIEGILSQNIPIAVKVDDEAHKLYAEDQIIVTFQPASIQGVVTNNQDLDGDGKPDPVAGAIVKITKDFDGDGVIDFSGEAITGADGSYSIAIPRGDVDYDVAITKEMQVGGVTKPMTFKQTAHVGAVTGSGDETFTSTKTISGIVETRSSDGQTLLEPPVGDSLLVYFKDAATGLYIADSEGKPKGFPVAGDGTFSAADINQGNYLMEVRYKHADGDELVINRKSDGTFPQVSVNNDGQLNIDEELIDPYGTITDAKTGKPVEGVHVVLYYADTERNRDKGIAPNMPVGLPPLLSFAPNGNANPQESDPFGNYAFMVFAHTDYYLVATKEGYEKHTSPTITVETAIVRYSMALKSIEAPVGGGGFAFIPPEPQKEPEQSNDPVEAATNLIIGQTVFREGSSVPIMLDFSNLSEERMGDGTVKLQLPEGVTVVDADGGEVEGQTIVWRIESVDPGKTITFKPVLQLPQIGDKEKQFEFVSTFDYKGKLVNPETAVSSVKLNVVSDRYGDQEHQRYMTGYPDLTFKADRSLTRAELAAIMARLIGKYDGADPGYKDVDSTSWAFGYIKAVTEAGLFEGYEDHRFLPDQPVTRAELVSVMVRYLKLKTGTPIGLHFTDIEGSWAMADIEALYRNHMVNGYGDGTFKPSSPIRRVEAVVLIDQMLYRGPLTDIAPTFPDIPANYWGFGHIEESSVSHKSTWDEQGVEHFIGEIDDQIK